MFSKHCHVLGLSCSGFLSGRLVQSELSKLSCPVQYVLSWPVCPAPAGLSQLSCLSCPVPNALLQATLSTAFQIPLSCHGSTVISVLSMFTWLGWPVRQTYSGCHVLAVLSRLSFPSCPVPVTCLGCPVQLVLSQSPLSTGMIVQSWSSCLSCPVLVVMFWWSASVFSPGCIIPSVVSDFPVPVLLSWL